MKIKFLIFNLVFVVNSYSADIKELNEKLIGNNLEQQKIIQKTISYRYSTIKCCFCKCFTFSFTLDLPAKITFDDLKKIICEKIKNNGYPCNNMDSLEFYFYREYTFFENTPNRYCVDSENKIDIESYNEIIVYSTIF